MTPFRLRREIAEGKAPSVVDVSLPDEPEPEFFDPSAFEEPHDFFANTDERRELARNSRLSPDMSERQYHNDPDGILRLSNSVGGLLLDESPNHAWRAHPLLGRKPLPSWVEEKRQRNLDFGTVVHKLLLGGDTGYEVIQTRYPEGDKDEERRGKLVTDRRTKAAKEEAKRIEDEGKIALLEKETDRFERVAAMVRERMDALGVGLTGRSEVTALWMSPEGIPCKGRLDHLIEDPDWITIPDIKTCSNANPDKLDQHIVDCNYHMQAAAYTEAAETIFPEHAGRVRFIDVFVVLKWPYYVVPVPIVGSMLELGQRKWKRAKRAWRKCLDESYWPDYARGGFVHIEPRRYAVEKEEMRSYGT